MKCIHCGKIAETGSICNKCLNDSIYEDKAEEFFSKCQHRHKDFCPGCDFIIQCMDFNIAHRVKRSELLRDSTPGTEVIVDGISYCKPKQACVNCSKMEFRKDNPFCTANHSRIKMENIDIPRNDCEFWDFKTMEER